MANDDVLIITTAYEQGVGHALRDELSNPYTEGDGRARLAWDMGREFGRQRAADRALNARAAEPEMWVNPIELARLKQDGARVLNGASYRLNEMSMPLYATPPAQPALVGAEGLPDDLWALVRAYGDCRSDVAVNSRDVSAAQYLKLAESNLRDALAALASRPVGDGGADGPWVVVDANNNNTMVGGPFAHAETADCHRKMLEINASDAQNKSWNLWVMRRYRFSTDQQDTPA